MRCRRKDLLSGSGAGECSQVFLIFYSSSSGDQIWSSGCFGFSISQCYAPFSVFLFILCIDGRFGESCMSV